MRELLDCASGAAFHSYVSKQQQGSSGESSLFLDFTDHSETLVQRTSRCYYINMH